MIYKTYKKLLSLVVAIIVMGTSVPAKAVHIAENNENQIQDIEEKVEEIITFLVLEAAIYDENDNIVTYNFEMIRRKYGDDFALRELEEAIEKNIKHQNSGGKRRKRAVVVDSMCVADYLMGSWGGATTKILAEEGIKAFIKNRSFKEAAKIISKKLPYLSVAAIAADLLWATNKCGEKTYQIPEACGANPIHSQGGCH